MRAMKIAVVTAAAMTLVNSRPALAEWLIGTQVTGELHFVGYEQNFFDPANHFVPAGYLNVTGPTVIISSNAVEFGYADSAATISADFTNGQLVVTDHPLVTSTYPPIELAFSNAAFSNLSLGADSFPYGGMSASLSGTVLTLNWGGGSVTRDQSLQAVYYLNVPQAPPLNIQLTPTNSVVISWPAPSTGFKLQQNNTLNPMNWVGVLATPTIVNGRKQVIVSPPVGTEFYRLKYQ